MYHFKMTLAEMKEDGDTKRLNAITPPSTSTRALEVFNFLRDNDNHVTVLTAGMGASVTTGLNREALTTVAPTYGLDIGKYWPLINMYENAMLKEHE